MALDESKMNYTISRLPFIILAYSYHFFVMGLMSDDSVMILSIVLLSMPLFTIFVAMPRARDCGWLRR